MAVLICKNIEKEGPETIEIFLKKKGISYTIVELYLNDNIPNTKLFDTLIMLGGPMSVNEDAIYPYIKKEMDLVKEFSSQNKKVFGVCLGAQIIAKALGSNIYKGSEREIGWYNIELTKEALKDTCMSKLAYDSKSNEILDKFKVFQWHGETFDIPKGATKLAQSHLYPNQAFKYGENTYAFQFHIEVKKDTIYQWLKDEIADLTRLNKETDELYESYYERANNFYEAFFK